MHYVKIVICKFAGLFFIFLQMCKNRFYFLVKKLVDTNFIFGRHIFLDGFSKNFIFKLESFE